MRRCNFQAVYVPQFVLWKLSHVGTWRARGSGNTVEECERIRATTGEHKTLILPYGQIPEDSRKCSPA